MNPSDEKSPMSPRNACVKGRGDGSSIICGALAIAAKRIVRAAFMARALEPKREGIVTHRRPFGPGCPTLLRHVPDRERGGDGKWSARDCASPLWSWPARRGAP